MSPPEVVATDGKTLGRAPAGGHPLHMGAAWAFSRRRVPGQEVTDTMASEIRVLPLLPERLQRAGALVTIDAMATQTGCAKTVLTRGAVCLPALKDNQKAPPPGLPCSWPRPTVRPGA